MSSEMELMFIEVVEEWSVDREVSDPSFKLRFSLNGGGVGLS